MRLLLILPLITACAFAQDAKPAAEKPFQMDHYIMVFLYRAPNRPNIPEAESNKIQEGHMANIRHMGEIGKLLLAGPFEDNGDLRGLFLFKPGVSIDEVKKLVDADPAVKAGRLRYEIHPWFAAKGIQIVQ
jgi:uncharacterized protein YciI